MAEILAQPQLLNQTRHVLQILTILRSAEVYLRYAILIGAISLAAAPTRLWGHGGGLAADGCHNDRKNGGRHCHRGSQNSSPMPQRARGAGIYFPNCASVRAAGAAPVLAGEPGYGRHLDRDGDGIGCE